MACPPLCKPLTFELNFVAAWHASPLCKPLTFELNFVAAWYASPLRKPLTFELNCRGEARLAREVAE